MSAPSRSAWICTERSGVSTWREPSMGLAKVAASSVTLVSLDRDMTWNPPESVRIGPLQPLKRCRPPRRWTRSAPGRSIRCTVLPRMMSAPVERTWSMVRALTVAAVPTGMKAGVRMSPRAVRSTPVRAAPSRAWISKGNAATQAGSARHSRLASP